MTAAGAGAAARFPYVLTLFAALCLAVLTGLGLWQLDRLEWKTRLIKTIETGLSANPVALTDVEAGIEHGLDVDWLRARATGRFRHDQERHIYSLRGGKAGYQVATPLETAEGLTVWVDRGFVPEALKDPATRPQGQVGGVVEVTGLIRVREGERGWFTPPNDAERNVWITWDLAAMSAAAEPPLSGAVLAVALEAQGAAPPGGHPIPWDRSTIELPNRHLEYAITWFGLALCLAGVYIAVLVSRHRQRPR